MATHVVPKGSIPYVEFTVKPWLSPAKRGGLRQPVKSIKRVKTPAWLSECRDDFGVGYCKTWVGRYR